MHHRAGGFCAVVAGLLVMTASLVFAGAARPLPSCNLGQITKFGDPSLSAPSPTYPGSTITSTGGSWGSCNESFTGFYAEWLRDGVVVSGPTFVASSPGSFTYAAQSADVGHSIRSGIQPCNADGCYGSYAVSSNAVVPAAPPPPPPPPPPSTAPIVVTGYVRDASGAGVFGAAVALFRDVDTDSALTQSPLMTTTTDASGYYVLRAANAGDVAADTAANEGWANFSVEATTGNAPYHDVVARHWNAATGTWQSPDDVTSQGGVGGSSASTPASDPLADDLAPMAAASIVAGDGPNVSGPCRFALQKTSLVGTEIDPTTIGELHVARDATGTFYYGRGGRADSYISIGISAGGWHLGGFKHIATANSASISVTNPTDDWAHEITSRFVYGRYRHERWTVDPATGQIFTCGVWSTKEARLWIGDYAIGQNLSQFLHLCTTQYTRYASSYGVNGTFARSTRRLRTYQAGARVDLGTGSLDLRVWSGASSHVGYSYKFGTAYQQHWLCGNDNWPPYSTRIFAGG